MDYLTCSLTIVALGGMVKYFDGRIVHGLSLLPKEEYLGFMGLTLAAIYLCLAINFSELLGIWDLPAVGLTVGWVGLSWCLMARHLRAPEGAEHIFEWTGNHLLLTGCFYSLLGIRMLLTL